MEVFEIQNLDCRRKESRAKLMRETMLLLKLSEKPATSYLEKVCKSIGKKYAMRIHMILYSRDGDTCNVSVEKGKGSYSMLNNCFSYYEILCKFILLVKAEKDYRSKKVQ